jgi:Site-specific recombinase XerD
VEQRTRDRVKTEALEVLRGNAIAEAHALWLESVALTTPSQRTVRNYERTTRPFLTFLYERQKTDLDAVQPHDIRAYLLQLKNAGRAPHTLAKHYTILRAFWNWCLREELTTNDPFRKVEKPKAPPKVKPALTPEEVEQILQSCDGKHWLRLRDKALVMLCWTRDCAFTRRTNSRSETLRENRCSSRARAVSSASCFFPLKYALQSDGISKRARTH